ncbi:GAF domain-containing protein [Pollutibacter soli]|uniref:GAF domain-containing protein n=1 Tax=Pollutibacter soli TaxID=3034157 RepID=UPI0030132E50
MPATSISFFIRRAKFIRYFIVIGCLFSRLNTFGQSQNERGVPEIDDYTVNGLTNSQMWAVTQDKQGFLYFGGTLDIFQYDGSRWRALNLPGEVVSSVYRALEADSNGVLYYGTSGDFGYLIKDSIGNNKKSSLLNLVPEQYRKFQDVRSIQITPQGTYFQVRSHLFRVSPDKRVKVWTPTTSFMYSFFVNGEYFVHEQNKGLYKLINDSLTLIPGSEFIGKDRMQVMLPFDDGKGNKKFLIALFNAGLYLFDGKTFERFSSEANEIITQYSVYKAMLLPDKTYALGTIGAGIIIIDQSGKIVQRINKTSGLADDLVYSMLIDRDKNLWVGHDVGISKVKLSSPFTYFRSLQGITSSPLSLTRFEGSLYTGVASGLLKLNPEKQAFERVTAIPQSQIFDLHVDRDQLLVSNDGFYSLKNGKVKTIRESVSGDFSTLVIFRPKANRNLLFVGSNESFFIFYRDSTIRSAEWELLGSAPGINESVWTFSEDIDHPGECWAGTQNSAVYRVQFPLTGKPKKTDLKVKKYDASNGFGKLPGITTSLLGHPIFTGDSGFYRFNYKTENFYQDTLLGIYPRGGGINESLIGTDKAGRIWLRIGHRTNILTPNGNGYSIDSTSMEPLAKYSIAQIYHDQDGISWLAATDAMIRYDSKLAAEENNSFPAILRFVRNGKTTYNPELHQTSGSLLHFPFKNNSLRFDFTAPYYDNETRTEYQTMLDGYDDDWSSFSNSNYKEYTNLPSGKYTFRVRAQNVYGTISKEASYTFIITTPWYFTWWAWTIYAIAAIALISLLVRWRTKHLHEQHRELEKIVNDRTKQLSQRVEELAVINKVQESLVSEQDINSIYRMIGEKIREIFHAQVIDIVSYDENSRVIEDKYSYEKGDTTLLGPRPLQGFRKSVAETGEVVLLNKDVARISKEKNVIAVIGEIPKSVVIVPMISNKKLTGMISLQDLDKENAFSESDVNLLKTLSNSMSVALESAKRFDETKRLLKETEQRNAELGVINSVQEGLVSELSMQGIFDLVGEKIRGIFHADVMDIVMYDRENNTIEDRYAFEKGDLTKLGPRPLQGFRKEVAESGEVMVINSNLDEIARQKNIGALIGEVPKSIVIVPMMVNNQVSGMISLQDMERENAYTESDISLLKTLANSMTVALESARRFDETKRLLKETEQRNAELDVINRVQDGLVREMNIQGIFDLVGEKIREIFNAQVIDIVMYDSKLNQIEDRYSFEKGDRTLVGARKPEGFRKLVIENRQPIFVTDNFEAAARAANNSVHVGDLPKSAAFFPLIAGNEVKGVISLQNLDRENAFSDADHNLLNTLSNSMSVALESARLFDETARLLKETEQRNAELAVINSVQDGLVREMNMQGIFDLVGEKIREIFNAQVIDIVMYDKDSNTIEDRYAYEKGDRSLIGPRTPSGFRKHIIQTLQPIFIDANYSSAAAKYDNAIIFGETPKSAALVPLIAGNEVKGIISLQNLDKEYAFSESDHSLLTTLSNSMSVALESARLFDETTRLLKETEQRNAELAVINSVQEGLVAHMDIQEIYDLVGEKIREIFNAQVIDIVTYDSKSNLIEDRYAYENGDRTTLPARIPSGFRKHVIETRQVLLHNENVAEESKKFGNEVMYGVQPKSQVFVPMIAGGEIKGIISLQNLDKEFAFKESDVRLLTTLSNSMSVALESARLFDETKRLLLETEQRTAELGVINVVQEGLVREIDEQAIYNLVGEKMREIFNAQVIDIVTYDKNKNIISDKYAFEKGDRTLLAPRQPNGYRKYVIESKQMLLLNSDMERHAAFYGNEVIVGEMTKSAVFVPLIEANEVTGIVSLQNIDQENAFSESDLRLLVTLSNSLSIALQNARLFDETKRLLKETEQRTAELATINKVQEGLVREMNAESIYEMVGEKMREVFNAQVVDIVTYDRKANIIEDRYAYEKGDRSKVAAREPYGIRKHIIETKQMLLINSGMRDYEEKFVNPIFVGQGAKSAVFVPMFEGNEVTGIVSLQNLDEENAFTDSDVKMLVTLSNSLSIALQNARLFEETNRLLNQAKQRSAELQTVNNVSKTLASQLNADELIARVGNQMKELFNANIVYLALLNEKTRTIFFPYQYGEVMNPRKIGEGLTSQVLITGEPLLLNSEIESSTTALGFQRVGLPAASYLGVPIPDGDKIIGVLSVQSTEQENRFTENDQRVLSTIAASVGVALRNARLFEEVQLAKLEAETASKIAEKANEAKSAFLSTVSHELRTPLTSVLGFAKIIRKRLEEKIFPLTNQSDPKTEKVIQQVSENLNVVVAEGERLTHLINDVLDLAKIEAGKMEWSEEWVSIPEIVERASSATSALFDQKGLAIEKIYGSDLPEIRGDRDKLIQVVVNLLSNAVKFTDQGIVTCKVSRTDSDIIVDVTDTGIGIAAIDHNAVFEQFRQVGDTLTDKPKGTGLGLPICKEIIEHHGGRIWLESEIGKGSTFSFSIPIEVNEELKPVPLNDLVAQLKEQMAQSRLNNKTQTSTILIVDDDDSIRSLLYQELSDAGYLIEEATNGKEALASIRANRPDLVILDVMMPEMNGFDVAAVLKNDPQTLDIPIIVLSIVQDKARGFRIGVDRYLTKPIDTGILFNEVDSLLQQGKSRKKVLVVDEDQTTVRTLVDVLKSKGYQVVESDGKELVTKAMDTQPDIIILNSLISEKHDLTQSLRLEKGMENVLFLVYQ